MSARKGRKARRRAVAGAATAAAAALVAPWVSAGAPSAPPGARTEGPARPVEPGAARLLVDATAWDPAAGRRIERQEIFDEVLRLVAGARSVLVLDFFLWNPWQGPQPERHRALSSELTAALLDRKRRDPAVDILVLTDPINSAYGGAPPPFGAELAAAGIPVVTTDLAGLRDPNPLYSRPARFFGPWLDALPAVRRRLDRPSRPHPFDPGGAPVSTRQWLRLLHLKANHRKVVVADGADGELRVLATSLNPADGSSAHSNVGLLVRGGPAFDALRSELDLIEWSARRGGAGSASASAAVGRAAAAIRRRHPAPESPPVAGGPRAAWVTEGAIRDRLVARLEAAGRGDAVRVALFYLSDRAVVRALFGAARRGASLRLLLDANRDAFGRAKNGIPNRAVAAELVGAARREGLDLLVRWADTHGEQFHAKAILVDPSAGGEPWLMAGSANWTRRNLGDLNLEANLVVEGDAGTAAAFRSFFDAAWANFDGLARSVPYERFAETALSLAWKKPLCRFQEATGLCAF